MDTICGGTTCLKSDCRLASKMNASFLAQNVDNISTEAVFLNDSALEVKENLTDEEIAYNLATSVYKNFEKMFTNVSYQIQLVCCFFGILSSILTLATICRNKNFSDPCFICYKALAGFEFLYAMCNAIDFFFVLNDHLMKSYAWTWLDSVVTAFLNPILNCSILVIVFLSLHRAVACLIPQKFHKMDNEFVCYGVAIGVILASVAFFAPALSSAGNVVWWNDHYIAPLNGDFWDNINYDLYVKFLNNYRLVQATAIFGSSTLAIVGMLKAVVLRYSTVNKNFYFCVTYNASE